MDDGYTRLDVLEERSPSLFLVGGAVLVFYGACNGIEAFTDVAVPANIFESGYVFAFLGLLGLYPTLADEGHRLARAGAGAATVGLVGVSLVSLRSFGHLAGLVSEYPAGWSAIILLVLVGFIGGYLALGLVALRSEAYSTTVGLVLTAPGVIVVLMLLHIAAGLDSSASVFVVSSGQAMAHLAIGETLRRQSSRPEEESTEKITPSVATDD